MNWGAWLTGLTSLGGLAGITAVILLWPRIRKLRSETSRIDVDAALAVGSADDAHLRTVVEFVVEPLTRRVDDLEDEVKRLREEIQTVRRKYYRLLDWAREVMTWARVWHADAQPPPPAIPPEIQPDV